MAQKLKRLPGMQETWIQSLGWEDPLEKAMAPHSSTLAWRIPWREEPGGLQSTGRKESHTTECLHFQFGSFETSWTIANQAPLSMGFSRQEYWSGLSFPSPGDLSDPRIKHLFPVAPTLVGGFFTTEPPGKPF